MKRILSMVCLVAVLFTMVTLPQASAASNAAQTFANKALAEIGKTGKDYGYTDEWCARWIDDLADQAGIGSSIPAQDNTAAMARWFHQNGRRFALTRRNASGTIKCWTCGTWSSDLPTANYTFVPAVGDIAFFETNNRVDDGIDHVGIVVAVSGNAVAVVEGNTGSQNNALSKVSKNTYDWKQNGSKIWGFARPSACGSMPAASAPTQITTGPNAAVSVNTRSCSAIVSWNRVTGADWYELELYDAAGWAKLQQNIYGGYLQKIYNVAGTSYTFLNLDRSKTYYVKVAACNKAGQWKFGSEARFTIGSSTATATTKIVALISSRTCRGYLTVASNQKAYTNSALTGFDNSYIYTSDYCRIVKSVGTSLLVEYPTSSGTKQRWIAASRFFCNYNYAVWSKTARQSITVKSRPGAGVSVGSVYKDDLVYVLGESGSYYQVLYPAGGVWKFGYLQKSML